eukprot:CAMPEP_0194515226 /NCGR_PEP_ID=MMETSP0253-20130528/47856_1 /TAXON_ID=2966 /ORGANISM="Noctiluca scintillans" /LENGTH=192 /DNA_ID=CAMNT_0039358957 /DNA_START=153 /DNA_END=731 /DNA_ORIENTATION=-
MSTKWITGHQWLFIISNAMLLVTLCAILCCRDLARRFPANYALLFALTLAEGVALGFTSSRYTGLSVIFAASLTAGIFLLMTAYACLTKTDFTGLGPYLFAALCGLFLFGLVLSVLTLCGVSIHLARMIYAIIGALLFTFYIIYDTQLVLGCWGGHQEQFSIDDYAYAALSLYLDIINVFLFLLQLFGSRDS